MRVNQWEGVWATITIKPTLQMLIDAELDPRIVELELDVVHSGYDDPGWRAADPDDSRAPECECDIDEILHVVAYHADGNIFDLDDSVHAAIMDDHDMCELIIEELL